MLVRQFKFYLLPIFYLFTLIALHSQSTIRFRFFEMLGEMPLMMNIFLNISGFLFVYPLMQVETYAIFFSFVMIYLIYLKVRTEIDFYYYKKRFYSEHPNVKASR